MDIFDRMLNNVASVLIRTNGPGDAYGTSPKTFTVIQANVPCRLSTVAKGRPKEYKQGKKFEVKYVTVFMRPWVNPNDQTPLTHDHWLFINNKYYDIFQINDPSGAGHHYEIDCELVEV